MWVIEPEMRTLRYIHTVIVSELACVVGMWLVGEPGTVARWEATGRQGPGSKSTRPKTKTQTSGIETAHSQSEPTTHFLLPLCLSTHSATHDDRLRLDRRRRRRRRGALARGREPEGRIRAVEAGEAEVVLVLRAHPVVGVAALERPLALHG